MWQDSGIGADRAWVLVAGAIVFFMQAGFLCLEVGSVQPRAVPITALKKTLAWVVATVAFFFVGWAISFGHSRGTWFGGDLFMLDGSTKGGLPLGIGIHFLFQLAFAATAATIVSGALAERTAFVAYGLVCVVVTALIYPVVAHWVWGNSFFTDNKTLLSQYGFIDFAGSTVVHSVGGWVSLIGIWMVGPRLGRFRPDGTVKPVEQGGMQWVAVGCLMLWFSWWGFNGGSTLSLNQQVGPIIINTNLAGALGGIGALLHCWLFQKKDGISGKFLNGLLAGLVGITANCHIVTPLGALLIGFTSGIVTNLVTDLLIKVKLDDPVGAVPVHLGAGVWGTLCVGLFGKASMFPNGHTRLEQIGVQLLGIGVVAAWVVGVAFVCLFLIKRLVGFRVSPQLELSGFDIGGERQQHPADEGLDEAELRKLMGDPK